MTVTDVSLPHDLQNERAVLGAVLVRPEALLEVPWLLPTDFYRTAHRCVWARYEDSSTTARPST